MARLWYVVHEFAAEYGHTDVCGPCCVSVLRRLNGQQQVADCARDIEGNIPLQHCAARCRRRRAWTKWSCFCRKTPLWVCGCEEQPCPNFLNQEEREAHGQVVICRDEFAAEYGHTDVCGPCCVSVLRRLNGQQQVADCARDIEGNIPLQHCAARCRRRRAWTKWSCFCRKTPLWVCGCEEQPCPKWTKKKGRSPWPGCDMSWWVCSGVRPHRRLRTLLRVRTPPPKRAAAGCRLCQGHRRQHPRCSIVQWGVAFDVHGRSEAGSAGRRLCDC